MPATLRLSPAEYRDLIRTEPPLAGIPAAPPVPRPTRVLFAFGWFLLSAPAGAGATHQRACAGPAELLSEEYAVWCACWEAYYTPGEWVEVEPEEAAP